MKGLGRFIPAENAMEGGRLIFSENYGYCPHAENGKKKKKHERNK
jgi:hypothetical protein